MQTLLNLTVHLTPDSYKVMVAFEDIACSEKVNFIWNWTQYDNEFYFEDKEVGKFIFPQLFVAKNTQLDFSNLSLSHTFVNGWDWETPVWFIFILYTVNPNFINLPKFH